jgi:hypothetical protein
MHERWFHINKKKSEVMGKATNLAKIKIKGGLMKCKEQGMSMMVPFE